MRKLLPILLLLTLAPAAPLPALAAEAPKAKVAMALTAESRSDGQVALTARVTQADSNGAADLPVHFVVATEFMGKKKPVAIGTAKTDGSGSASVSYAPTWDGEHRFEAATDGNDRFSGAVASARVQLQSSTPAYVPAPPPLFRFRLASLSGALTVMLGVWLLLLGVVVRMIIGMRAGRSAP